MKLRILGGGRGSQAGFLEPGSDQPVDGLAHLWIARRIECVGGGELRLRLGYFSDLLWIQGPPIDSKVIDGPIPEIAGVGPGASDLVAGSPAGGSRASVMRCFDAIDEDAICLAV